MSRILVVEDTPDNMDLIEEILEDAGYKILMAETAETGIDLLREQGAELVLMDISLPEMDGLQATQVIKADDQIKHIPVIALTAHAMQSDKEKALAAGCDGYMTKPIDEQELLGVINRILN